MEQTRFKVVFERLAGATAGEGASSEAMAFVYELDGISELRRLVVELSEPEPQSYTLT